MQEELLTFEQGFTQAVAANDVAAIGRFVADDWVIVDANGSVINRSRFISVIESGALTHESMESTDVEVRVHGDTAVVTVWNAGGSARVSGPSLPRGATRCRMSGRRRILGHVADPIGLYVPTVRPLGEAMSVRPT